MAYCHRYFALLLTVSVFVVELHAVTTEQTLLAREILNVDRTLKCQRMKTNYGRMCESFGYNMTRMPNLLEPPKAARSLCPSAGLLATHSKPMLFRAFIPLVYVPLPYVLNQGGSQFGPSAPDAVPWSLRTCLKRLSANDDPPWLHLAGADEM